MEHSKSKSTQPSLRADGTPCTCPRLHLLLKPHPKIALRLGPRQHGGVDEHLAEVLQVLGEVESAGGRVMMVMAVMSVVAVAGIGRVPFGHGVQ